jgi:hypothetical protein
MTRSTAENEFVQQATEQEDFQATNIMQSDFEDSVSATELFGDTVPMDIMDELNNSARKTAEDKYKEDEEKNLIDNKFFKFDTMKELPDPGYDMEQGAIVDEDVTVSATLYQEFFGKQE